MSCAKTLTPEQQQLVERNVRLVYKWAHKLHRPRAIEFEDLVQVGMLALCQAALVYDPAKSSFSNIASIYIMHHMQNAQTTISARHPTLSLPEGYEEFFADEKSDPERDALSRLEWEKIAECVRSMGPMQAQIVFLRLQGLTQHQIAEKLGTYQVYVWRELERIRRAVRKL